MPVNRAGRQAAAYENLRADRTRFGIGWEEGVAFIQRARGAALALARAREGVRSRGEGRARCGSRDVTRGGS